MFSFFRRNKNKANNNNNEPPAKLSLNMQLAVERQQASLQQSLEKRRKNDVNAREQQNDVTSQLLKNANKNVDDLFKNRSAALPSAESERDKSNVLGSGTCAQPKPQNFDQYRDARRSSYLQTDIENTNRQAITPINIYQPSNVERISPTVFTAPITDQKCSTSNAGTSSTTAYNSVYEAMGRGRNNRNKNRGGPSTLQPNLNKSFVKNQKSEEENVSKNIFNVSEEVMRENGNVNSRKFEHHPSKELQNLNTSAAAVENSEKSASISSENVFHEENSCSINSQQENKNDNIATSDEGKTAAASSSEATNIVSAHHEKYENLVESVVANGVKNDEKPEQQVGALLQRTPSAKRVTFAPSPPRSIASSQSDDDETLSDDIFYEAAEVQNDNQKLRILSTVTSHSSECTRIDEEAFEVDCSSSSGDCSSSCSSNNNDLVCAKIILSVDENESLSDEERIEDIKLRSAFSSDETSISSDVDSAPKTVKPSYLLIGEDTIALPDIVAETSLLEHQQQQHQKQLDDDDTATLGSQASSYNGNSSASHQIEVVDHMQLKVNELCMKMDELQRELEIKNIAVDRLQSELVSTNKESECVRQRLRYQDEQLEKVKESKDLSAEEEQTKYAALEEQSNETTEKLKKMQSLASNLNVQLAQASVDVETLRQGRDEILDKLSAQEKLIRDILETAMEEREQIVAKWKHEFEELRNHNCDREEHLMEDCEWKLRQMMKQCKDKMEKVEKEKLALVDQVQHDQETIQSQRDEIRNLKACEREANQLRGLTSEQAESISSMLRRIDDLKADLSNVKARLQDETDSCLQIKRDCAYQLSEKERSTNNRVEIARGEAAMEWEERLMEEMCRLTHELEQVHMDERNSALNKQKQEYLLETLSLTTQFKSHEKKLSDEIETLKNELIKKQEDMRETQTRADTQLLENRAYLDRKEREHEKEVAKLEAELERHLRHHSDLIEEIKGEHKREKEQIKASFYRSLEQIKEEFANEITLTTETLQAKHKREMEEQWKQLVREKEAALLAAEHRQRIKLEDAENKLSALKLKHQRQLSDVKDQFDLEKARQDTSDVSNAHEIDTLRRKCICLTKLFEEMRMRYERRDPRPEDLRQIDELKSVVDSQEKDIFDLTEQLRELQLEQQIQQMQHHSNHSNQQNNNQSKKNKGGKNNKTNNNSNKFVNNNGNSNNNEHEAREQSPDPSEQTKQSASHERDQQQKTKPPPLIKTVIYEEENENELYEQQIREEREIAKKNQAFESEFHSQQNGVTVFVPESPDYTTKHKHMEISEAHILSGHDIMNNVPDVVFSQTPSSDDKHQEMRVEHISTIEPAYFQIVPNCNGRAQQLEMELD